MRLFIASSFPEPILRDLNERVNAIRSRLPAASWVRPETQHLTYAFLGEQHPSLVDEVAPLLSQRLGAMGAFDATLHGCGFFPNPRHARVGWVGLDPDQKFSAVARVVRDVVTAAGVTLDRADFKAHLTLMRMRDGWPPSSIELFTKSLREYRSQPFALDRVTLYSSELNPKGAIHTALHQFAL
ncbi:MAG TPA: RNA 2',3'-cyclic phosphodiesterase [Thermoanaerobaculia bacterium]|jgi:2'-5' RNA ligase